jgi:hypothetical protein
MFCSYLVFGSFWPFLGVFAVIWVKCGHFSFNLPHEYWHHYLCVTYFGLALMALEVLLLRKYMRINLFYVCAVVVAASTSFTTLHAESADASAERMARLEARLVQLEARLAETEQETKEVKVLAASGTAGVSNASILGNAATYDILANSAWRNLRWTQEEQWTNIKRGMTEEQVIEFLGAPPRSVKSLKPRVDKVAYYETSLRDTVNSLRGEISYRKGKVIAFEKPNFQFVK